MAKNTTLHTEIVGPIEATIYMRPGDPTGMWVTLTKTRARDGAWEVFTNIGAGNISNVIDALDRTRAWLAEQRQTRKQDSVAEATIDHEQEHEQERDR
jgi:hypothetical protein